MAAAISIILPVYNGMPYLKHAVQSVLRQEFEDFEFIILDDCSTDGSWEYLQAVADSRIKLMRNEKNLGLFPNLNFLIRQSSAPLIKLWSQDDVMYPGCINSIIKFHGQHPQIGFSYTGRDFIDEAGTVTHVHSNDATPEIVSKELHAAIACFTGSIAGNIANVTISRLALDECGLFNEQMKISGDFEMWVRLSLKFPIGFISSNLIQLRNHTGQLSRQEQYYIYHMQEDLEAYKILFGGLTPLQQAKGRKLLCLHKLMFYYTLMVKAFLKGHIKTGIGFMKPLHRFANIFLLTGLYIKTKISGRAKFAMEPL